MTWEDKGFYLELRAGEWKATVGPESLFVRFCIFNLRDGPGFFHWKMILESRRFFFRRSAMKAAEIELAKRLL